MTSSAKVPFARQQGFRDAVRRITRSGAALLLGLAAAAIADSPAEAQNRVGFEGRAGMGLPAFELADIVDAGPSVGLDLTYALGERGDLTLGGDLEFLRGREPGGGLVATPDLTAWHYALGVEVQLLAPHTTYWRLRTGGGIGGSTYDAEGGASESALAVFGNLELGYKFSSEADFFVGVKGWVAFPDDPDEAAPVPGPLAGLDDTAWSFPVTAGLRLDF